MKHLIRVILTIVLFALSTNQALAVNFSQQDKQKHLAVSSGISTLTYAVSRKHNISRTKSFFWAMGVSLAAGAAKELTDPVIDKEDLAADLIGASLGSLFSITIDF